MYSKRPQIAIFKLGIVHVRLFGTLEYLLSFEQLLKSEFYYSEHSYINKKPMQEYVCSYKSTKNGKIFSNQNLDLLFEFPYINTEFTN